MFPTSLAQAPQAPVSLHYQWYRYHSPPHWRQPQPSCSPLDWLPFWTYLHCHKAEGRQQWCLFSLLWELAMEVGSVILSPTLFSFHCPLLQVNRLWPLVCEWDVQTGQWCSDRVVLHQPQTEQCEFATHTTWQSHVITWHHMTLIWHSHGIIYFLYAHSWSLQTEATGVSMSQGMRERPTHAMTSHSPQITSGSKVSTPLRAMIVTCLSTYWGTMLPIKQ